MNTICKKRYAVIMFFIVFAVSLRAQDLIVTNEGDSINCKITNVKSDIIYFTFRSGDEVLNTLLSVGKIDNYVIDYYSTAEVQVEAPRGVSREVQREVSRETPREKNMGKEIYPHFRFAASGGWSYRTARLSPDIQSDFKNYYNKLKSGWHYDLGASYFFSEQLGVGLKYNEFRTSNEIDIYVDFEDGTTEYGSMGDNYRIKFIGPTFSTRLLNSTKKNCLLLELGLGYMDYRDKGHVLSMPVTIKGGTVGTYWSIGYDFGLTENLALGFQISSLSGTLYQITRSSGTQSVTEKLAKDKYENLSRIELSVGLRFNK